MPKGQRYSAYAIGVSPASGLPACGDGPSRTLKGLTLSLIVRRVGLADIMHGPRLRPSASTASSGARPFLRSLRPITAPVSVGGGAEAIRLPVLRSRFTPNAHIWASQGVLRVIAAITEVPERPIVRRLPILRGPRRRARGVSAQADERRSEVTIFIRCHPARGSHVLTLDTRGTPKASRVLIPNTLIRDAIRAMRAIALI